jgi:hypothetical protein
MIALGLDPSLTGFGWCVHDSDAVGPSRIVARGRIVTTPKDVFVVRYMAIRKCIIEILEEHPSVRCVGVESPPFGELWSEGLYALFTYVNEALFIMRRDVVYFDPGTVKMLAKQDPKVRQGKMFKSDMVEAARADCGGFKGRLNHNEADAYHIGRFAARFWKLLDGEIGEADLTPSEYQAFARVHTFQRGDRAGQTLKTGAIFKENQRFYRFSRLGPHNLDAVAKWIKS